jgi:transcriptional regulator with XRE-family HTH domain
MTPLLNLVDLGRRVRAARLARRLTLEQVVAGTNFTIGWLSKLENGQLSPSLEGLVKVATVLDCRLESFLEGLAATPRHVVCRRGAGGLKRHRNGNGAAVENLADAWRGRRMHPRILHVAKARGGRQAESFPGERFLMVLEGSVRLAYGEEQVPLEAGDSVYIDAVIPHGVIAVGATARVLSVSCDGEATAAVSRQPDDRASAKSAAKTRDRASGRT